MRAWGPPAVAACALVCALAAPRVALGLDAEAVYRGRDGFSADVAQLTEAFERAVPGDRQEGRLSLVNGGDAPIAVTLWTEPQDAASEALLEEARLTLLAEGGEVLFDGPVASDGLADPATLGTLAPGEQTGLEFSLSIDRSVGNGAALREASVNVVLCADELAEEVAASDGRTGSVARTGDQVFSVGAALLVFAALATVAVLGARPRKGES
ncbi:hypothetical protein AAK967_02520 [Atopobiaceae bacterium 24-176]